MAINDLGARQSGRTYRQLEALPEGAIFLVHSMAFAGYCRNLLRKMGRSYRSIRFATPNNFRVFEGARAPAFAVDHAFWEIASAARAAEARDFLALTVSPYA